MGIRLTVNDIVSNSMTVMGLDPHGWVNGGIEWTTLIEKVQPKTIMEVGVWLGMTTKYFASFPFVKEITCVDYWDATKIDPNSIDMNQQSDNRKGTMYEQFLSNCVHYKIADKVYPLRMSSLDGAKVCKELGLKFDMIWIDADHSTESTRNDIEAYLPFLNKGGLMCGDDFNWVTEPYSVKNAVEAMAIKYNFKVNNFGGFWYYE